MVWLFCSLTEGKRLLAALLEVVVDTTELPFGDSSENARDAVVDAAANTCDEIAEERPNQTPRPESNPHIDMLFVVSSQRREFQAGSALFPTFDVFKRNVVGRIKVVLSAELATHVHVLVVRSSAVEEPPSH
jgi:hypothetical protein